MQAAKHKFAVFGAGEGVGDQGPGEVGRRSGKVGQEGGAFGVGTGPRLFQRCATRAWM
ncbi:hypothetical protein JCM4814A_94530 [Streptomyces phaeofaciens JCM 4814]|uniref:Uncharacterized protein n=1 Tax=Streptomyces phaeofaciens TaxID=68254 RepID=A0A918M111_9ACTN|nr:hypothetical protein GCM10010226_88270 [Streptomyces phaeofaciens]